MKFCAVTTTINVPHVIRQMATLDGDVFFIVIGDEKTNDNAVRAALEGTPSSYYGVEEQKELGFRCSELISWSSIQRRNVGFLLALRTGAKSIISFDDDNAPLDREHFAHFRRTVGMPFSGLQIGMAGEWFDVGSLQYTRANGCVRQRGFPIGVRSSNDITSTTLVRVGVAQGIALGDPDTSAVDRISQQPDIHQVSELLRAGIVANPRAWSVFNSQNVCLLPELIPAFGMVPFVGRFDDIYASLLCQRIARERGLYVHFGPPFVWQNRNQHNLVKDLRGELEGMENIQNLAYVLDQIVLKGRSVIDDCRTIWAVLNHCEWMPTRAVTAMMAYLDDAEAVLKQQKAVA